MFETILISIVILVISLLLLGVKMIFTKGGEFPNTHVSGNPKMQEDGVSCAQSQDRAARGPSRYEEFIEANK